MKKTRFARAVDRRFATTFAVSLASTLIGCHGAPPPPKENSLVRAVRIQSGEGLTTFRATGDVHARVQSNLAFQASGKVIERLADVGDHVEAGAVLARLDPVQQQADVTIAAAAVDSASSTLARAKLDMDRQRALFANQHTAKAQVDEAERNEAIAESALSGATAKLALSRRTLSYAVLRAAHSGTLSARTIDVGQVVDTGATVFTLNEDGPRDAVFRVDERVATRLGSTTSFPVALVDDPKVQSPGTVREIAPEIEVGTGSILVKVGLQDPPPKMSLGAAVVATLQLAVTRTFRLPEEAVVSNTDSAPAVWVIDPASKAVSLRVVVVASYESRSVVIGKGLADGDLVVTSGASRLRPGQIVRVDDMGPS